MESMLVKVVTSLKNSSYFSFLKTGDSSIISLTMESLRFSSIFSSFSFRSGLAITLKILELAV